MKKQNRYGTIAALTLSLCLVATHAFAADCNLINSSGGPIKAKCADDSSYSEMVNGATQSFTCSGDLVVIVAQGAGRPYNLSQWCLDMTAEITVKAGEDTGELSFSITCV